MRKGKGAGKGSKAALVMKSQPPQSAGVPAAMKGGAGAPGAAAPDVQAPADMQSLLMQMKKRKGMMSGGDVTGQ